MYGAGGHSIRYEEHAIVLDSRPRSRATTVRGRDGTIVTALGDGRFTLLEILAVQDASFKPRERICIGKDNRAKVDSVLGRIPYSKISPVAQMELQWAVESIVNKQEERFVGYVNTAGQITQRTHALEMIPGVGKMHARAIIEEREKKGFVSYQDMERRADFADPAARIAQRIVEEITGEARTCLFTKR